jgi:ferritin-like metal-binding protein YciE
MAQMIDLKDLLKHEILDLYSAEEQIIEALPKMVEKATNGELKKALSEHLKVTEQHRRRLDEIKGLLGEEPEEGKEEKKGFFSRIFGGSGGEKCKGTEGLIKEGEKMMGEDMTPETMDAAIIGAAQKIEHYEICGYGTAAAYARELRLSNIAGLLQQTLNEEYQADDALTALAVGKLNIESENATPEDMESSKRNGSSAIRSSNAKSPSSKSGSNGSSSKTNGVSKANATTSKKSSNSKASIPSKGSVSKSKGSKNGTKSASKSSSSKTNSSKQESSKASKPSDNKSAGKLSSKSVQNSRSKNVSKGNKTSGKRRLIRER